MAVPVIHPGEHLAEELKELNMSAAALARQLNVPTNRITEILNGRREASPRALRGIESGEAYVPHVRLRLSR